MRFRSRTRKDERGASLLRALCLLGSDMDLESGSRSAPAFRLPLPADILSRTSALQICISRSVVLLAFAFCSSIFLHVVYCFFMEDALPDDPSMVLLFQCDSEAICACRQPSSALATPTHPPPQHPPPQHDT